MIKDEEISDKFAVLKHDYVRCRICRGILHINDNRCRWCGGKKKTMLAGFDFMRLITMLVAFLLFYCFGALKFNFLIVLLTDFLASAFFSKKFKVRWMKKNIF